MDHIGACDDLHGPLVGALDQGTSSTRFLVFTSRFAQLLTFEQHEVDVICPRQGWVEADANQLLSSSLRCIEKAVENLRTLSISDNAIATIGITNQRESTVVWDRSTGVPLYNAILWLDLRTAATVETLINRCPERDKDHLKPLCGLPLSTYFSAVKLRWLLDNVCAVRDACERGHLMFGTVDSWLVWNMTGGVDGGVHLTDVTNASRTMLMNIHTLDWDPHLCRFFDIPMSVLPEIRSSSEVYGRITIGSLSGTPISGILGDQQAALVGQRCFKQGQAKNTYGTGCFLLYNTGHKIVMSDNGLLTTVAYQMGSGEQAVYALEGSVAIAGAAVRWLRDNLTMIRDTSEIERLASQVADTGGVYVVPAFSGLYAPHWDTSARGTICGITQFTDRRHICRAVLEAICFQTRDIIDAMCSDSGIQLTCLQVDGGASVNNILLQLQADLIGIDIARPSMCETTALGAAMMAGVAMGLDIWASGATAACPIDTFCPSISHNERELRLERWREAVCRSRGWIQSQTSQGSCLSGRRLNLLSSVVPSLFVMSSFALLILASQRNSIN